MDMIKHIYKVTVIIPCFNRESFIRETIDSVLNQTYEPVEIIVIDDGSTDGSRDVLESYKDKIILLEHPGRVNRGQSAAINLGLDQSSGEYIAILDSDDLFDKDKIKRQVEILDNMPDIGVVYCNGFFINEKNDILYKILPDNHNESNKPERMLLECHFNIPSNSLVRKSIYDKIGNYDETMRSAQDHDMGIRIMEVTKAFFINETLWYYRRHCDSQSSRHALRRWQTGFQILEKAMNRYPYGKRVEFKRRAVLHFRVGQCYIEQRHYVRAISHFMLAAVYDPVRSLQVVFRIDSITSPH